MTESTEQVSAEDVRVAVYTVFAQTGMAPSVQTLASRLNCPEEKIRLYLRRLAELRHIVIDDTDRLLMAHPFSAIPLGFSVMGRKTLWWGGCAWDSFALPHLLVDESEVLIATRCPACDKGHAWSVNRWSPPTGRQVAHFLVPVSELWNDVIHACRHQRLFCDETCVDEWLADTHNAKGQVLELSTLWELASHWYDGRLDHGYLRRDPSTATDYFRNVGLSGPFWSA